MVLFSGTSSEYRSNVGLISSLLVPENKTRDNINLTTTRESSCCDDQYVARSLHNYSTVKNYLYT